MRVRSLHSWDVSYAEAVRMQEFLGKKIKPGPLPSRLRYVAGADVSYEKHGDTFFAGVVVWDLKRGKAVEEAGARGMVNFPYIPGLLSFREAPVLVKAFGKVSSRVDAVIVDGQGVAHPRRFGLASHICLLVDKPGAGCAKTRLVGEHEQPGENKGDRTDLIHHGERVGIVLRTRKGVKPVFVSTGHRLGADEAAELVLMCTGKYRLPEPVRMAHNYVNRLRRKGAP